MQLSAFCCCCDLRRGCLIYAWLQMMGITITIASLIASSDMITILATSNTGDSTNFYKQLNVVAIMKVIIGIIFIKGVTCIALIWGVVQKNHVYFQPWLFITGLETSVLSLVVLVFFALGFSTPTYFAGSLFYGGAAALNWYFWACVYTVYQRDMKPSVISFELHCNSSKQPADL